MSAYVQGEHALGICDKCGVRCEHNKLKEEMYHGSRRGFLVCPDCWDPDHPQLFVNKIDATDAQAIRNARPDTGQRSSRSFFGWNPLTGEIIDFRTGTVTFGNS